MNVLYIKILHVAGVFALLGYTFYACAAAPETRKKVLMITGIMSLLVILTGGAMLGSQHMGFPGWAIVKLFCWLGISAFSGVAYRKRDKAPLFMSLTLLLAVIALTMVYLKPF